LKSILAIGDELSLKSAGTGTLRDRVVKSTRLAPTQDDGFHEIQLNGKQLVFLFMAATVVSVVIFLCGVLVGRGVRAERGLTVADASAATDPTPVPQQPAATPAAAPAGSDPRAAAAPPPAGDDLSYFDRLEKDGQPKENLKAAPDNPSSEKSAARMAAEPARPAAKAAPAATAPAKPAAVVPEKAAPAPREARAVPPPTPKEQKSAADASGEFAVQVAALNVRGEADAIARRLTSKGYSAYVVPPGNGAVMFRVRVGHFRTRRDAEPVFARLQKEEQFKPWITR
jgi:cell division septation protein DedD